MSTWHEAPRHTSRDAREATISPSPSAEPFSSQAIPMAVWHAQQAQDHQWAAMDIQQQQHRTQEGLDEELAQAESMQWHNRCYICAMAGRDREHELYQCQHPDSQTAKKWMKDVRGVIPYAPLTACYSCGMPQTICRGWENRQRCAYRGMLVSMVAMMLFGPWRSQIEPIWQRRLQAMGVDAQDQAQVVQFLGQAHPEQERHNQLFVSFCWLRRLYQEIKR
ncbi:hypothetical protein CNMCM5793_008815 [Aspergillus hiratsukae]|uniref:Uncharacterized protein n=1 Tax=Aspergillus hiratsukae TaxID=1194566 RepID=A0A8H6PHJ6_9EURO|nr:hypothetical protein CNMCM5793_008815 [Aspergillus hiratsukae]